MSAILNNSFGTSGRGIHETHGIKTLDDHFTNFKEQLPVPSSGNYLTNIMKSQIQMK